MKEVRTTEAKRRLRRLKTQLLLKMKKVLPEAEFWFLASVASVFPPFLTSFISLFTKNNNIYNNNE
jgi:hypothetical protein